MIHELALGCLIILENKYLRSILDLGILNLLPALKQTKHIVLYFHYSESSVYT